MEQWQQEIILEKLQQVKRQLFSLEVDLRVARKIGNTEGEKQVIEMLKKVEAAQLALEAELGGA